MTDNSSPRLHLWRRPFVEGQPTLGSFLMEVHRSVMRHTFVRSIELPWMNNAPKVSCIPPGEPGAEAVYSMRFTMSKRFGKKLWEVMDVEGRSGIRIHTGNYSGPEVSDSLGCILPVRQWTDLNKDGVIDGSGSKEAIAMLHEELRPYEATGIDLVVRNAK